MKKSIASVFALILTVRVFAADPEFVVGYEYPAAHGKVPTTETFRRMIDILSELGYNQFHLYLKNTFAYTNHPAALKRNPAPVTAEEIRALDDYCAKKGIELVPYQASFGHMEPWLAMPEYNHLAETPKGVHTKTPKLDCGPISLCATDPASISFLSGLYDELLPNFRTKKINVGCDEVWDLLDPNCRSAAEVKRLGAGRVYLNCILKMHENIQARGHVMMCWADMIFLHPELVPDMPKKNIIALDWGYEATSPFEHHGAALEKAGVPFYVCPGTSGWGSLFGRVDNMKKNIDNALAAAKKHGGSGLLLTEWGDGNHPQPWIAGLPGIVYAVSRAKGEEMDDAKLAAAIDRVTRCTCGEALIRYGNLYLKCGVIRGNGTALYDLFQKASGYKRPKTMTEEKMADVFAEWRAAKATLNLNGAPDWVKEDFELLDLLATAVELRWKGQHEALASLAPRYRELWVKQNKPGNIDASAKHLFRR